MANSTVSEAAAIHGMNPQFLVEKIIRSRIYDSIFWKEHCFALTEKSHDPSPQRAFPPAETLVDKAVDLKYVGGQYGVQRPSEFLCLTLKLLQLQPDKSIIRIYLQNEEYKYLTALTAFYIRLTFNSVECYQYLEPLLLDKRKLRMRDAQGNYYLSYLDEFADSLLRSDRVCDIALPRITRRAVLVEARELEDRISPLEADLLDGDDEDGIALEEGEERERQAPLPPMPV
ncbi:PRP38 family-domain-containing protein, partial [Zopfochytrium polystomum]